MLNLEHAVQVVLWISLIVLAVDLLLVIFILGRRLIRSLYFSRKDAATRQFTAPVQSFLAGDLPADDLVTRLQTIRHRAGRDAIRNLLVECLEGDGRKAITEVLFRLGYIEGWAREAFGRARSRLLIRNIVAQENLPPATGRKLVRIRRLRLFCIRRARAVALLGHLDPSFAQVFTREALYDPSPYVGRAIIAAMGYNQQAYEVPVLLELLRQTVKGSNELPSGSVKAALARYSISHLDQFVPFLEDDDPRYRFLLVDTIREICDGVKFGLNAQDFPRSLYHWFLNHGTQDDSIDVRARSARVIRHFHDAAAALTLRGMMLDKNEFVRLHTVRACADPFYSDLGDDITRRINDPRWRVREAAVKTLAAFGKAGRTQLAGFFLTTTDQFASEQLVEEMQRNGIIAEMLPALSGENGEFSLATNVCAKMVRMGKTSLLTNLLEQETRMNRWAPASSAEPATQSAQKARAQLLDILLLSPTPELITTVRSLAERKDDQLSAKAQTVLESYEIAVVAAPATNSGSLRRSTHA